jgi:bile acid:Na+ symporter, BASS family
MDLRQLVILGLQVSILFTVFSFGLNATVRDVQYLLQRPGLLVRSLLSVLIIMPLLAVVMTRVFDVRATAEIALVALAISPVPPLLPNRESKGGGHQSYGIALMAVLAVLALVTIPLSVAILGRITGHSFSGNAPAVGRLVLITTVVPLAAGMAVRALWPTTAARLEKPVALVGKVLLILGGLALLAGAWRAVLAATGEGAVLAFIGFVVAGFVIGDFMGRPRPEHSIVLGLASACRHPAIALSLASANFPDERFGGTILLYLLLNVIVGVFYLAWHRRRTAAPATAGGM